MEFKEIYALNPYELSVHEKENIILPYLNKLVCHHYKNSEEYHNIIDIVYGGELNADSISEIPFLPVRLFKELVLKSVSNDRIIKTMTSSGTTGTRPSRIYLDKETAERQQKVMIKILSDYIGGKRLPMLIIDNKKVLRDRNMLAVRGAAILGFSMAGSKREFALNEDMSFNKEHCIEFLDTHRNEKILIFGFTSMIWQYLYKVFEDSEINLENAILIHGGGWKKLEAESVDNTQFKEALRRRFGIHEIYDYYGMVEQTGCIYMECQYGHLHVSNFSDVLISVCSTNRPLKLACEY